MTRTAEFSFFSSKFSIKLLADDRASHTKAFWKLGSGKTGMMMVRNEGTNNFGNNAPTGSDCCPGPARFDIRITWFYALKPRVYFILKLWPGFPIENAWESELAHGIKRKTPWMYVCIIIYIWTGVRADPHKSCFSNGRPHDEKKSESCPGVVSRRPYTESNTDWSGIQAARIYLNQISLMTLTKSSSSYRPCEKGWIECEIPHEKTCHIVQRVGIK